MAKQEVILELENIIKKFPGVTALDGVRLDVRKGEVHALCGENGAGKSTLMKIIAGAQKYTKGKMIVNGKEEKFGSTREAEKAGITMIYQEFNLIPELSVAENMYLGNLPSNSIKKVDWNLLYQKSDEILKKLKLKFDSRVRVSSLSVAEAQMVEIAKCLTKGTKVIIMDEPTAALTDEEIETLFETILDLKQHGIAVLYISHRMDEIFKISDRLTVFRDGKYIATKDIQDTDYDDVVTMMVGKSVEQLYPIRAYEKQEVAMELKNVSGKGVHNVNLKLHKGEILGISGLLGAGTIKLLKLIYGAAPMKEGQVFINGSEVKCTSPKAALNAGIGFVSDDRKQEGLVLIRDIKENMSLSSLKKISKGIHLDAKLEKINQEKQVNRLNIKISSLAQIVGKLSGGNQQKVVFAKVLEAEPDILLLAEPTRGVDVGAKAEIYQIMDELTQMGKSIILVSTDLPEVIGMSDRVIVMREGHVKLEISKEEMNQEVILAHASGGVE